MRRLVHSLLRRCAAYDEVGNRVDGLAPVATLLGRVAADQSRTVLKEPKGVATSKRNLSLFLRRCAAGRIVIFRRSDATMYAAFQWQGDCRVPSPLAPGLTIREDAFSIRPSPGQDEA